MFEVGRLVARVALEGATTFGQDLNKLGKEFTGLDDKGRQAATNVGQSLTLVGGAILGVVGVAVAKFAEFDKAMSEVNAVTQTTVSNQGKLRDAALEAGAATKYSATEAADAEVSLAKAGVQTADIIGGGLTGALALAAAGQVSVADAADTAATAMTQFGLAGSQIPHVADLLAAGAGKAQGGVDDLSMALKQSGLVASQFGVSVDDTIGTLSAFASAGLIGSDAGTSFRTMMLSLANPSGKAADAMKQYNIQAFDAKGNFVGLTGLAGQLTQGFKGATDAQRLQAMATIFGTDAIRAANVLYTQGSAGIADWTAKVNDSGYAARQAAALQDNLAGDVEKLGGSFDTAFIQSGAAANDVLRQMVQIVTEAVNAYGSLSPEIQAAGLYIGVAAGAVTLLGGAFLLAVPKIVEFRLALATLSTQMPTAAKGIGAVTGVLKILPQIAVVAFLGELASGFTHAAKQALGLEETVDTLSEKLKSGLDTKTIDDQLAGTFGTNGLARFTDSGWAAGATKGVADFLASVSKIAPALSWASGGQAEFTDKISTLDKSMAQLVQSGNAGVAADQYAYLKTKTDGSAEALQHLSELFPEYLKAQADAGDATAEGAEKTATAATAYEDAAKGAQDLNDQVLQLIDSINTANGVGQDAVTANSNYQEALAKVADTIAQAKAGHDGYSTSLDQSTTAGAANAAMFSDLAAKSQAAAKAQFDVDGNTKNYQATLEGGRQKLIDQITALTGNAAAATKFADSVYKIPTKREFQLIAQTATAQNQVDRFINTNDGRRLKVIVDAVGGQTYQAVNGAGQAISPKFNANGGIVRYYANGGNTGYENHVAQIAKSGVTRVWSEPETGGELYAPLAQSKRGRSMAVIGQQLNEWGYDIVPQRGTPGPGASAPASAGVQRIVGTLDLGNGLTGIIDGRIENAFAADGQESERGYRDDV